MCVCVCVRVRSVNRLVLFVTSRSAWSASIGCGWSRHFAWLLYLCCRELGAGNISELVSEKQLQRSNWFAELCFCVKFMFCWFCSLNRVILCATDAWFILCTNKIYTYVLKKSYFIFPITKGLVHALMKLAGFSTSNKVKNHCFRMYMVNVRLFR